MTKLRVLIVDDDRDIADTLALIVERSGYDVTVAYDGEEAVKCAERQAIDCAFIDIMLPNIDGVEALARIRKLRPQLKAYMMTGYSLRELNARALEEGALDVLSKPTMPEDILGKLSETSPGTILIADDDPVFTEIVSTTLQTAGWNVQTAENGLQAVDITSRGGINAMVLDLEMPVMNGDEVCAELRRRGIDIPIIVVSASKYSKQQFDGYNIKSFMRKPIAPRELLNFLEQHIRRPHGQAA